MQTLYRFPHNQIKMRLQEVTVTHHQNIDVILRYLLESNGKMLRPQLVHIAGSLLEHDEKLLVDIAVAVELIHLASLVHDDVIDEAGLRRGRASVNACFGNHASVLTGDYLFATAFRLVNNCGKAEIMETLTEAIQIMCSGEIKQMAMLYDMNLSEKEYYDKIYSKTACLFASSCRVGALAADMDSRDVSLLEQYGLCLGFAYQIIDDVLDFVSDSSLVGKPTGNDLLQGNITLPVIIALRHEKYGPKLKEMLQKDVITPERMTLIAQLIKDSGALYESIESCQAFLRVGLKLLNDLPGRHLNDKLADFSRYFLEDYYQKLLPVSKTVSIIKK